MEQTQFSWDKKDHNEWKGIKKRARNNEVVQNSSGSAFISQFAFFFFLVGERRGRGGREESPGHLANENLSPLIFWTSRTSPECAEFLQVNFGTALPRQWIAELQISEVQTKYVLNFAIYLAYYVSDKESQDTTVSEGLTVSRSSTNIR